MSTNYYLHEGEQPCKCCGHSSDREPTHIGRSSYGWCFALHVMPEIGIHNLDDWINLINNGVYTIMDEYYEIVSVDTLLEIILGRRAGHWCAETLPTNPDPRDTYPILYHPNHPTLRRHIVDGDFCIAHGPNDATYDCIIGIFS